MKLSRYVCLCLLFFVFMLQTGETVASKREAFAKLIKNPQEHWYNVIGMGTKMGYMYTHSQRVEYQGETMLRFSSEFVVDFKQFGENLKAEVKHIEYVDSNLIPRYFIYISNTPEDQEQTEGRIINNVAYITTKLNGRTAKHELTVPDDTLSESVIEIYMLSKNRLRIPDTLRYHALSYDAVPQFVKSDIRIVTSDIFTYHAEEIPVYIFETEEDILDGTTSRSWVGRGGTIYKSILEMEGLSFEITKTDMKTALGTNVQKPTADQVYDNAIRSVMWIVNPGIGEGSGILIDKEFKLAVTNAHVTERQNTIDVYFPVSDEDGKLIKGRDFYLTNSSVLKRLGYYTKGQVVARDEETDLAIIRLEGLPETAREIDWNSNTSTMNTGNLVYILGNPAGQDLWRWTLGEFMSEWGDFLHIQSDILGGNSGGPVLNKQGTLIGIVARSDSHMNVLAIPVRYVNQLLSESRLQRSRSRR